MAWTLPRSWSTSEVVTSAQMNTHLRDNLRALQHHAFVSTTTVDVVSTAAGTNLFGVAGATVAGGEMGARGLVVCDLYGDYLYNNSASDTVSLLFYFHNTLCATVTGGGSLSAARSPWRIQVHVMNMGATNSQLLSAVVWMVPPGGNQLSLGANVLSGGVGQGTAAEDSTTAKVMSVNMSWSAASSNNSFRCLASRVQVLEAS